MAEVRPEIFELVRRITSGECTRAQAEGELNRIEKKYSPSVFTYHPPDRKEKPWDKAYLDELADLFYCGASSKEFIRYMAEVSEEVYHPKRKGNKKTLQTIACAAFIAFIVLIILIIIACHLADTQAPPTDTQTPLTNTQIPEGQ